MWRRSCQWIGLRLFYGQCQIQVRIQKPTEQCSLKKFNMDAKDFVLGRNPIQCVGKTPFPLITMLFLVL